MSTLAEADPERDNIPQSDSRAPFTAWHGATIALLAFGYSGYYFCRSNLSVVLPDLIHDLAQHGVTASQAQVRLGFIASAGTMAYAAGKFISGSLADLFGGRRNFLGGMAGSILFTILFVLSGGFPLFTLAWVGNRLFQSTGWVGLVKVASRWFSYSTYGTVMAVLSLSYLFGDAACRWVMSQLMALGVGWRGVFLAAAGSLAVLLLANLMLLRETPEERGLPAPEANPLNVYGAETNTGVKSTPGCRAILGRCSTSFPFWMVCLLSLGTTLLRETFNFWTPTYFVQYVGLTSSEAAARSALFPLFGGISVLVAGVLSDKLGLNGRNLVLVGGMAASTVCLVAAGAHAGPRQPMDAGGAGHAGGLPAAGTLFLSCRRDEPGFRRQARQRHSGGNHRRRRLPGGLALGRYGGAHHRCVRLEECVSCAWRVLRFLPRWWRWCWRRIRGCAEPASGGGLTRMQMISSSRRSL